MNTANTLVTQMIKPADYDKVITPQEAVALNNNIAMIASKTNVDRALLPTYKAGESLASQVFGWRQNMDNFRKKMAQEALNISRANLKLAQDREARLASGTGNDGLIKLTSKVHELENEQSALASLPAELMTDDTKRKILILDKQLKFAREDLYKMQVQLNVFDEKAIQDINDSLQNIIQFSLTPSFNPADIASAQATAKEINKKQQTSSKGKQPPRMAGNIPSNPEPLPVDPNLIPKPTGTPKPTGKPQPQPQPQSKPTGKSKFTLKN